MKRARRASDGLDRRQLLKGGLAGGALLAGGMVWSRCAPAPDGPAVFVGRASDYSADLRSLLLRGFRELGVSPGELAGKRVLLKPNLVETLAESVHINTHPAVVRAAIEAFLHLGAAEVLVGEGPGHRRDTRRTVVESGLAEVLREDRIPFVDLNYEPAMTVRNAGGRTGMRALLLPRVLSAVDWIVSMPKLKTHHWAGVTLSMKNLFGLMPGLYYGWPKNLLHWAGIEESILDINATVPISFAIADGIVGMEGDGPIMGEPRKAGVVAMSRHPLALDATCARLMRIDPTKVAYLAAADGWLGTLDAAAIPQVGETLAESAVRFELVEGIKAHRGISY